jgi:hypothetical protein
LGCQRCPAIQAATTPEEARAAANEWAELVRTDPTLLAGAAKYLLDRDVNQAELFDSDGCATQTAVDLVGELKVALALSSITPSEAPADAYNSGTDGQQVVGAANPGIGGNRKAILIEAPNGTKIWVMARCGNPVTEGAPPVPVGPTDEGPPPSEPKTPCPPPQGVPLRFWDPVRCVKLNTPFDYQQNESPARQDPQDNTTSGIDTGPTPGAPTTPFVPPPGPTPQPNTPAPPPTPGGYDSGSPNGSGTPGGSTCDSGGCTGGGPTPPPPGPPVTVDTGTHTGDPGGF